MWTKEKICKELFAPYGENEFAVSCRTGIEAREMCDFLHINNFIWNGGEPYTGDTMFETYQENTVYTLDGKFGSVKYSSPFKKIMPFQEFKERIINNSDFIKKETEIKCFLFEREI